MDRDEALTTSALVASACIQRCRVAERALTLESGMISSEVQELINYPEKMWGEPASQRWVALCQQMCEYQPPQRSLILPRERKWETVSAVQKAVRRGDKRTALRSISALVGMGEHAYLWRRLPVIACEDVGLAHDTLVSFVVTCSSLFARKKTPEKSYHICCFLTEQMTALERRSRVYCSFSGIEVAAIQADLPRLPQGDELIISAILRQKSEVQAAHSVWKTWQKKNDWRAQRLLRFVGLRLPLAMEKVEEPPPPFKMLAELPSYCYDMYTRVGLRVLSCLRKGVKGAEDIREFFLENKVKNPQKVIGEALFSIEGGKIQGELIYAPLSRLEQRLFAHQFGLPLESWLHLQNLVEKALKDGVIDRVRMEVLEQVYCGKLCK